MLIMTFEQAIYYKYLLICGYSDELNKHINICLNDENPISDIILNLSACGSNNKEMLTVLNDFTSKVSDEKINYDKVFDLVLTFLRTQYREENLSMEKITDLMYQISVLTEKISDNPWWTMFTIGVLYSEAEQGYITMGSFMGTFENFINKGICMEQHNIKAPTNKPSFFKRLLFKQKK